MSNKKLAGSRHNKKYKIHKTTRKEYTYDPYVEHTPDTLYAQLVHNCMGVKPNHRTRIYDITLCWPLIRPEHILFNLGKVK